MKVAIMQPYFLPYLGYFQLMQKVDQFLILDDVNYIKGGWINRNRVIASKAAIWLTLPLENSSPNRTIHEHEAAFTTKASKKALRTIEQTYTKQGGFTEHIDLAAELLASYEGLLSQHLTSQLTQVCQHLDIDCQILPTSSIYDRQGLSGQDRILLLCEQLGVTQYINPPGGRDLYSSEQFRKQGIQLSFLEPELPEYPQPCPDFIPGLSIIDALLCNRRDEVVKMARGGVISN